MGRAQTPARRPDHEGKEGERRCEHVAAWGFAFSCFFPYPALALGGSTGLQLSELLSLASVPFLCLRPPGRPLRALLLILSAVYVSGFANLMAGEIPSVDILPKEAFAMTLALVVLWPSEWVARRDLFRRVLAAAIVAIIVHAAIGLYQVYSFTKDEFPLLWLYRNPSFKSMEEWSDVYALYIKRPCGLFPEPSAMGASLGPWLVVLSGLVLDPRLGRCVGWKGGRVATVALASGFTLLALSRSGSTFPTMGAVVVVWAGSLRRRDGDRARRGGAGRFVASILVLLGVVAVLGYAASRLSQGFDDRVESSWGLRALSIQGGLTANTDPLGLAFGVGPGQSTTVLRRNLAWVPLPGDQDELAVFSLAVFLYMENGLLGLLAMLAIFAMTLHAIVRSSAVLLGLCTFGAWLVGTVLTTSYMPLSAIWLCLGTLLSWDHLFPAPAVVAPGPRGNPPDDPPDPGLNFS